METQMRLRRGYGFEVDSIVVGVNEFGMDLFGPGDIHYFRPDGTQCTKEEAMVRKVDTDLHQMNFRLPADLHKRFRIATIERGDVMGKVLEDAVRQYLEEKTGRENPRKSP